MESKYFDAVLAEFAGKIVHRLLRPVVEMPWRAVDLNFVNLRLGNLSDQSRAKRLLVTAEAAGVDADLERAVLENARIRCTPDFKEGIASFLEKRKPVWKDE